MPKLRTDQDAWGAEIRALMTDASTPEIIERDDGRIESYPAAYLIAPFARWTTVERRATRLVRGRVLDIGAGAGRVALELQRRGHRVTAIDLSPGAIAACRKRGVRDARVLALADITPRLGTFDTVVMLGNNFGLVGTPARARRFLKLLATMTTPDALVLAQSLDPYRTRDRVHLAYHARNRKRGRPAGQTRIRARFGIRKTPWFELLFVSPDELASLVEGTGWTVERVLTDRSPVFVSILKRCADRPPSRRRDSTARAARDPRSRRTTRARAGTGRSRR